MGDATTAHACSAFFAQLEKKNPGHHARVLAYGPRLLCIYIVAYLGRQQLTKTVCSEESSPPR